MEEKHANISSNELMASFPSNVDVEPLSVQSPFGSVVYELGRAVVEQVINRFNAMRHYASCSPELVETLCDERLPYIFGSKQWYMSKLMMRKSVGLRLNRRECA